MALIAIFVIQFQPVNAQSNLADSNVSKETRAKLERVRLKYPDFKLSLLPELQECLDGKIIDPECDRAISVEVDVYEKGRSNAEAERNLAEMERAMNDVYIVFGSVQVGLLVFDDRSPSEKSDFIGPVIDSADSPVEVKHLFKDYLSRKERRERFTKLDAERLMSLANKHLDSARSLLLTQTNAKNKQLLSEVISDALKTLWMGQQILAARAVQ